MILKSNWKNTGEKAHVNAEPFYKDSNNNSSNYCSARYSFFNNSGFTLIEVMIVVVIIGILVAIAIPLYQQWTERSAERTNEANIRVIEGAIMKYIAEEGFQDCGGPSGGEWEDELVGEYLAEWPEPPERIYPDESYRVEDTHPNIEVVVE